MSEITEPRFTDELWEEVAGFYREIEGLEFVRRLGDGTLDPADFRFYLQQDAFYLAGYARALALLAARAPDRESGAFYSRSAYSAAATEVSLHETLLAGAQLSPPAEMPEPSPTALGYVSYLIAAAATETYAVAAAAVLPCFWIYAEVGQGLAGSARGVLTADPEHPYARWVSAYGDPDFAATAQRARHLVDAAAELASAGERAAMRRAFVTATRYEWQFFDSALHRVPWPATPEPANLSELAVTR